MDPDFGGFFWDGDIMLITNFDIGYSMFLLFFLGMQYYMINM